MSELDAIEAAALEAHYRAKFVAELERDGNAPTDSGVELERMPEDVQALVDEAREVAQAIRWGQSVGPADARRIDHLADALEAAYSQAEWEYRTLLGGGDPQPHSGLNSGRVSLAEWFSTGDERIASGLLTLERRRKAGPWEQVEKGADRDPR